MAPRSQYYIDVSHPGLNKFQRITGSDRDVVERRAAAKLAQWDEQWQKQCERAARAADAEAAREDRMAKAEYQSERALEADTLTAEAEAALEGLNHILAYTLSIDDTIDFEDLKTFAPFPSRKPQQTRTTPLPAEPAPIVRVYEPNPISFWRSLLELLWPPSKQKRVSGEQEEASYIRRQSENETQQLIAQWKARCGEIKSQNTSNEATYKRELSDWMNRKREYEAEQARENEAIDTFHSDYNAGDASAVEQYCDMVLTNSQYPDWMPGIHDPKYNDASRMLIINLRLPQPDDLPSIKSVKYIKSRDEMKESTITPAQNKKNYDAVIYQIIIRTLHELFEADKANTIDIITLNGIVETIDPATGNQINPCIASVQTDKESFSKLNLAAIDPKACFRKMNGIGSTQLYNIDPVAPIIVFNTEDARFIDGRNVLKGVNQGTNLASINWDDFEHLVRQLLELEYTSTGAEVKITRASRDGGIDAVIFDPDPLRGGKIVVQAKRYTNTVGVAAARELYGTMANERAARGILVTTAQYGSDSYSFAKDKPITLLDGSRLLHLLHKHGIQAYIDIAEARDRLRS